MYRLRTRLLLVPVPALVLGKVEGGLQVRLTAEGDPVWEEVIVRMMVWWSCLDLERGRGVSLRGEGEGEGMLLAIRGGVGVR